MAIRSFVSALSIHWKTPAGPLLFGGLFLQHFFRV